MVLRLVLRAGLLLHVRLAHGLADPRPVDTVEGEFAVPPAQSRRAGSGRLANWASLVLCAAEW